MSVAIPLARARLRFTSTSSCARPRSATAIAVAAPTAPVPTIAIFIRSSSRDAQRLVQRPALRAQELDELAARALPYERDRKAVRIDRFVAARQADFTVRHDGGRRNVASLTRLGFAR